MLMLLPVGSAGKEDDSAEDGKDKDEVENGAIGGKGDNDVTMQQQELLLLLLLLPPRFADDGNGCEPSDGCPGHGRASGTGEDDDGDVGERNDVVSMLLVIRLMLTVMVVAFFL